MNMTCFLFGFRNIRREEIEGKRVLEVGARDVNGSLCPLIKEYKPGEYIGTDMIQGPGVDVLCDAGRLVERFGAESFDAVVCTEVIEHVRDWKTVICNIKTVCRRGGIILLTTRSPGFIYHGWPYDFWRYDKDDLAYIFRDCLIERLEKDPDDGVLLKCVKPPDFCEAGPGSYALYSVVTGRKTVEVTDRNLRSCWFRSMIFRLKMKEFLVGIIERVFGGKRK